MEAKVISAALFTIYSVLTSFKQVPTQVTRQAQVTRQVQRSLNALEKQTLAPEQQQLLKIIRRRSGELTAHPTPAPLLPGTSDQRVIQLHALQQQQVMLNSSRVEELLAACTDPRKTSAETWKRLNPDQSSWRTEVGSVGEYAWKQLSQAWRMDRAAQRAAVDALDNENAVICAAASLLLQRGKDLAPETRLAAGASIMRILIDEERSRRPLDPPEHYFSKVWRLDDVLFETLRVMGELE